MRRDRRPGDTTVFDLRAIDHADRAARRYDVGRVEERPHHSLQSVGLDQGVRVHRANQLTARETEPDVQSVGLAAIFFVDHDERGISRGPIEGTHRLSFYPQLVDRLHRYEIEPINEYLYGPIF